MLAEPTLTGTADFAAKVKGRISKARESVVILSAYLRSEALEWLFESLPDDYVSQVTVVVRWLPDDLISGASDLGAFDLCNSRGFSFRRHPRLHAKCVVVDGSWIFVGSANLTRRGLGLASESNVELVLDAKLSPDAELVVQQIVNESTSISGDLVDLLREELKDLSSAEEPARLADDKAARVDSLLKACSGISIDDLFLTSPGSFSSAPREHRHHDTSILKISNFDVIPSAVDVKSAISRTPVWAWLETVLRNRLEGAISFGELTHLLHHQLDQTGPVRRKEVKILLSNTLEWIGFSGALAITIDHQASRHTTFIRAGDFGH